MNFHFTLGYAEKINPKFQSMLQLKQKNTFCFIACNIHNIYFQS